MKRVSINETPLKQDLQIAVVKKAAAVLDLLSEDVGNLSLHEIAGRLSMAKSSAYRLLYTWEKLGYVERAPVSGHYRLGLKAIELSRKVAGHNRIAHESRAMLTGLRDRFRESVYLGIYRNGRVVMIDMLPSPQAVRVVVDLGERCYLHASALGRSVAAHLNEDKLSELLRQTGMPKLTRHTNVSRIRLRSILAKIRADGYAVNREETVEGAVCIGAPFFSGTGAVLGAAAISIPVFRASDTLIRTMSVALRDATRKLSDQLTGLPVEPEALPRSRRHSAA
jgi:DNA-binding IclR family transcriptional regulator